MQEILRDQPIRRIGQPEEVAAAVLWLCSPGASLVLGVALPVDGGFAGLPRRALRSSTRPRPGTCGSGRTTRSTTSRSMTWNADYLVDEQHAQRLKRGTAQRYGLRVGEVSRPKALRVYRESTRGRPRWHGRFEWEALDSGSRRTSRSSSILATRTSGSTLCARTAGFDQARRCRAGRNRLSGHGFRDRAANSLLLRPD